MVPLACLLVLVPLVAGGSPQEMMQQMMMQQMMASKGWGNYNMGGNMGGQKEEPKQDPEDYEAYLKWCEERKTQMMEQEQQKHMLEEFEKAQAARREEMEKARIAAEQRERREALSAQMKMYQMRLSEMHEFDTALSGVMELKHQYMYGLTYEFMRFCKCSDFTEDLERYFHHGGASYKAGNEFDIDDLNGFRMDNAQDVARELANKPTVYVVKAFFGGLAYSMCDGARAYVEQVKGWEKTYKFLDRLM